MRRWKLLLLLLLRCKSTGFKSIHKGTKSRMKCTRGQGKNRPTRTGPELPKSLMVKNYDFPLQDHSPCTTSTYKMNEAEHGRASANCPSQPGHRWSCSPSPQMYGISGSWPFPPGRLCQGVLYHPLPTPAAGSMQEIIYMRYRSL